MSAPYIPLYVDDYDAATAHLTAEEDGVYGRLLRLCWRTPGCSVPNDAAWIARKIRLSAEEYDRVARPVIAEFFKVVRGRLVQKRLQSEWAKYHDKKRGRQEAGKKGGLAKARKEKENDPSNATVLPWQPEPEPEPVSTVEDKSSTPDPFVRPDPDGLAWAAAVNLLTDRAKLSADRARAFFGRLLSVNGLEARDLLAAVMQAEVNATQDPKAYLTRAASSIAKRRAPEARKAVGWV